jgi:DNA invertase Pin-like site-specific DNA recombinase
LENHGVGFRSFTKQYFDSCGIFKEAVISIMATLAKQERVRRSERTRAGLAIARSRGKKLGRPQLQTSVADIARLKAQGMSLRAIVRQLGIGDGSVRRLLASPA